MIEVAQSFKLLNGLSPPTLMRESINNLAVTQTAALLTCYGFELKGYPVPILIRKWLRHYQARWIRLAVVEALYQGRYKAISVEHILTLWQRRGQPNFHFSHEFEGLVCHNLPQASDNTNLLAKAFPENQVPISTFTPSPSETLPLPPTKPSFSMSLSSSPLVASKMTAWAESPKVLSPSDIRPAKVEAIATNQDSPNSNFSLTKIADKVPETKRSIHQFTPPLDNSELYEKLRAVVHQEDKSKK